MLFMEFSFYRCETDDVDTLRDFLFRVFQDAYDGLIAQPSIDAYMEKSFDANRIKAELSNPCSAFFLLSIDGVLAGCLKVNEASAQTDINDPQSLEIERIYLAKAFQNQGHGSILMNKAVEIANQQKLKYVWLGVWENNARALRFYKRNGFYKIGTHGFVMGEEQQTDYIMRKDL